MIDSPTGGSRQLSPASRHDLIDGAFEPDDAQRMLLALLDSEINSYKLQALGTSVRMEKSDPVAQQRIARLLSIRADVEAVLADARAEGAQVRLHSAVQIVIEPREQGTESGVFYG